MYIHVLSNYSVDTFPTNKPSHFRNILCNEIQISSNFTKVGLAEISFFKKFPLSDVSAKFLVFDWLKSEDSGKTYGKFYSLTLDQDFITNGHDLAYKMNENIMKSVPRLKEKKRNIFSYDNSKMWLEFQETDYITLVLKADTLILLGAVERAEPQQAIIVGRPKEALSYVYEGKTRYFSQGCQRKLPLSCPGIDFFAHEPKIAKIDFFLVFSNLCKESNVANQKVNLLRYVSVPNSKEGETVTVSYGKDIQYYELSQNSLSTIEIVLKSSDDSPLPLLADSHVRVCLHFT